MDAQEPGYRMYGQKIAPAFSALPPSVAVVSGGRMDAQEPGYRMYGQKIAPRQLLLHCANLLRPYSALPLSMAVVSGQQYAQVSVLLALASEL